VTAVDVVLPEGVHDPARPSGGNTYDRRICAGLTSLGWRVREHLIAGTWPLPGPAGGAALAEAFAGIPDGGLVLVDGLVSAAAPSALAAAAERLRLVVLVHMPAGDVPDGHEVVSTRDGERIVLTAAAAVVVTSRWSRDWLIREYELEPRRVHVAEPGADAAPLASGTQTGGRLLCVAAVAPHKGHDTLVAALAEIADLPWQCTCVGPLDRNPGYVAGIRRGVEEHGLRDRVCFTGTRVGADLDHAYAAADVLVLASRGESYGMVVTEALARGLPVVATAIGGVPESLGRTADGRPPGLLVPPDEPSALAQALRRWMQDTDLREQLRQAARERRGTLTGWASASARVAGVLGGLGQTRT
jgi:glycosyltransferase involved in cell wall biosynthesis